MVRVRTSLVAAAIGVATTLLATGQTARPAAAALPVPSPSLPFNQAPAVDAGRALVAEVNQPVVLRGNVTDDGIGWPPGFVSLTWSSSNAAHVSFDTPHQPSATAVFSAVGQYIVYLYATDGDRSSTDSIVVNVTPPGQSSRFLRIMALGDSITQGFVDGSDSYRAALWHSLTSARCTFDMAGSLWGPYTGAATDQTFDQNHEGHTGWRADQIAFAADGWMYKHDPQIVLLHIGTNDLYQGQSPQSTMDDIATVVGVLRHRNPSLTVLVSAIIPFSQDSRNAVAALNQQIRQMVASDTDSASRLVLVDQYSGFDPRSLTSDGVHPTAAGDLFMAQRWKARLLPLIAGSCG